MLEEEIHRVLAGTPPPPLLLRAFVRCVMPIYDLGAKIMLPVLYMPKTKSHFAIVFVSEYGHLLNLVGLASEGAL